MEITGTQYQPIEHCMPCQGSSGSVSHSNLQIFNAILYVADAEHDCKWGGLLKRFGNCHTTHTRMNRRAKSGVLSHVFGLHSGCLVQGDNQFAVDGTTVPCTTRATRSNDCSEGSRDFAASSPGSISLMSSSSPLFIFALIVEALRLY